MILAGRGSSLAFRTALNNGIPVFYVDTTQDKMQYKTQDKILHLQDNIKSIQGVDKEFDILPSGLFGIVRGCWCVPEVCHLRDLTNEDKIHACI